MYNIEKYSEGKLDRISLNLFERKMKKDKKFREKVILYQNVDAIMQGAVLAASSEKEMIEKKIDIIAFNFVQEFLTKNERYGSIRKYLSLA